MIGGPLPDALDALQDLHLRLLAEPLHAGDPSIAAGGLEVGQAGHAQRRAQGGDLLGPEIGDLQELEDPGRVAGPQLVERVAAAGGVQGGDLAGQRLADSRDLGEPLAGHQNAEVVRQPLQGAGAGLVRADLERVLALQLEERPDLSQRPGDGELVEHGLVILP